MRMPRPIDPTLHGVTDYTVGTLLMTAFPRLAGIEGTESAAQVRVAGAIHANLCRLVEAIDHHEQGLVCAIGHDRGWHASFEHVRHLRLGFPISDNGKNRTKVPVFTQLLEIIRGILSSAQAR